MDALNRITIAFAALVEQVTAGLRDALTTSYSVVTCDPIRQVVQVRSLDPEVSDLVELPLTTPGLIMNLPPGTIVRVGYSSGQPYVSGYSSGGIQPLPPGAGSGIINEIDAGYILITQVIAAPPAMPVAALYFPAGVAGKLAAETARNVAVTAGLAAFLLHMSGGRILPTAWTVP